MPIKKNDTNRPVRMSGVMRTKAVVASVVPGSSAACRGAFRCSRAGGSDAEMAGDNTVTGPAKIHAANSAAAPAPSAAAMAHATTSPGTSTRQGEVRGRSGEDTVLSTPFDIPSELSATKMVHALRWCVKRTAHGSTVHSGAMDSSSPSAASNTPVVAECTYGNVTRVGTRSMRAVRELSRPQRDTDATAWSRHTFVNTASEGRHERALSLPTNRGQRG